MKTFTIDTDNNITAFPTPDHAEAAVGAAASASVQKLRGLRTYVFPPLVQFETVPAAQFMPLRTNAPAALPPP